MFYFLAVVGPIAVAAGAAMVMFSIRMREDPLGAALLVAASVVITGGFVLVGLAATLRELRSVAQALRALKARAPGTPRQSRPVENWPEERRDGSDRRTTPARPPGSGRPGAALPPKFMPIDLDAPQPAAAAARNPPPEWLRRAAGETESDAQPAQAVAQDRRNPRAPDGALPPAGMQPRPTIAPDARLQSQTAMPSTVPEPVPPEPPPAPSAPVAEISKLPDDRPESQQNIFEAMWPASRRRPDRVQDRRETQRDAVSEPPTPPAASVVPAIPPAAPASPEPHRRTVLKSGVIEEMAYTLYSDGSIDAQIPDGTMRFGSIEELRSYLDRRES